MNKFTKAENDVLVEALARIYRNGSAASIAVADVCDTLLDKSGGLLGEVRNKARALAAKSSEDV